MCPFTFCFGESEGSFGALLSSAGPGGSLPVCNGSDGVSQPHAQEEVLALLLTFFFFNFTGV